MHSSRMCTIRCSGCGWGVYPSMQWAGGCIPACTGWGVYPSMHWAGGVYQGGVSLGGSAWGCLPRGGVCPEGGSAQKGCLPRGCLPQPPRQNERRLWKHNLAATTLRMVNIIAFRYYLKMLQLLNFQFFFVPFVYFFQIFIQPFLFLL